MESGESRTCCDSSVAKTFTGGEMRCRAGGRDALAGMIPPVFKGLRKS